MSEELRKRLLDLANANPEDTAEKRSYPSGWQPGVVWDGRRGEVTTGPVYEPPADWGPLLAERGLDPDMYEVDGDTIKWCSYDGWKRDEPGMPAYSAICYSFRAQIRLRRPTADQPDLFAMYGEARKAKRRKEIRSGVATLVVALSDWQMGNPDGGGIEAQMDAIAALPQQVTDRIADLRRQKVDVGQVCVAGLGDLHEQCWGFYSYQPFAVELDRREQQRVIRRGVFDLCRTVAPQVERFILTGVGGNHGEGNRQNGKRVTGANDNDDVAVLEQVGDILLSNPETFSNVSVRLPADRLAISLELSGQIQAFTHGHLAKMKSGDATKTMWEWWRDQMHGRHFPGVADATVLTGGHFHHFNVKEQYERTLFICPSLTNVSAYFGDQKGVRSNPGTLTYVLDPDGWGALEIIR